MLVNQASLSGYCKVEDQAFLSGMTGFHQFTRIGRLALVSALSASNKDVPPFMIAGGRPAVVVGINVVGLRRAGIPEPVRSEIKKAYKLLYRSRLTVSSALEKCKSLNMEGVIGFEGGCKIGKCISQNQYEKKPECINPSESEKMKRDLECRQNGMELVFEFNANGCNEMKCGQRNDCQKDMPKDSYSACAEKGGQLIVRRDQSGCVSFTDCVKRGEESSSFVENIDEVPDAGELLSIAFKLEDLKLQFDKLSKKTDDIANYYQSTGSNEEKRFRRVSDMFMAAKDKVDEIKTKLRDRSRDISVDDVMEIKQDITRSAD